jgi:hypothetical protein
VTHDIDASARQGPHPHLHIAAAAVHFDGANLLQLILIRNIAQTRRIVLRALFMLLMGNI